MNRKTLLHRAGAVLLALCLTLGLSVPAFAAEEASGMQNFVRTVTYTPFPDVADKAWYAESVKTAVELGIMTGKSGGKFDPMGNLTLAEAITMAAKTCSTYYGSALDVTFTPGGSPWYQNAVDYAVEMDIIPSADAYPDYTALATRTDMAYIFGMALPSDECARINRVPYIPDVNGDTARASIIFFLYSAGIVTGDSGSGAFRPDDNITRGEAAAIINRVALPQSRKTFTLPGALPGTPATTIDGGLTLTLPQTWKSEASTDADGISLLHCTPADDSAYLNVYTYSKAEFTGYDLDSFSQLYLDSDRKIYTAAELPYEIPNAIIYHGILANYYEVSLDDGTCYGVYLLEGKDAFYAMLEIWNAEVTSDEVFSQLLDTSYTVDIAL